MNTQLERMYKKTSVASVTILELRSRVYILETAMENKSRFRPTRRPTIMGVPWGACGIEYIRD